MPFIRFRVRRRVRISKGLPPLYIYNRRIIWGMLYKYELFQRRKKRKWVPRSEYKLSKSLRKWLSIVYSNVDTYYRLSKRTNDYGRVYYRMYLPILALPWLTHVEYQTRKKLRLMSKLLISYPYFTAVTTRYRKTYKYYKQWASWTENLNLSKLRGFRLKMKLDKIGIFGPRRVKKRAYSSFQHRNFRSKFLSRAYKHNESNKSAAGNRILFLSWFIRKYGNYLSFLHTSNTGKGDPFMLSLVWKRQLFYKDTHLRTQTKTNIKTFLHSNTRNVNSFISHMINVYIDWLSTRSCIRKYNTRLSHKYMNCRSDLILSYWKGGLSKYRLLRDILSNVCNVLLPIYHNSRFAYKNKLFRLSFFASHNLSFLSHYIKYSKYHSFFFFLYLLFVKNRRKHDVDFELLGHFFNVLLPSIRNYDTSLFVHNHFRSSIYRTKYKFKYKYKYKYKSKSKYKSKYKYKSKSKSKAKAKAKLVCFKSMYGKIHNNARTVLFFNLNIINSSIIPIKLNKLTFFITLYYYTTKFRSVINMSVLWCGLHNVDIFKRLKKNKFNHRLSMYLFFFRHIYFSELSRGLSLYLYSKLELQLFKKLIYEQRIYNELNIIDDVNIGILSFFIKYIYIDFLYSFLSKYKIKNRWISNTFFTYMLCSVSHSAIFSLLTKLLNKNSIRIYFYYFFNGYKKNKPVRLLFLLHNAVHSVFYIFWILRLYTRINNEIRLRCLVNKMFLFLLCNFNICSNITDVFMFFVLKLISLSKSMYNSFSLLCLDKYYRLTSIVFNIQLDNFRICNVGLSLFLHILYIGYRQRDFINLLFRYAVKLFTHQIEYTLFSYTHVQYLFFAKYYYKVVPPLTSARMLCNYMVIQMTNGLRIDKAFDAVYNWQMFWLNLLDTKSVAYDNMRDSFYPIKGIRIVCSGPLYKARRTQPKRYLVWVSNEYITRRMPLSTVALHIEYVQSFVVLRRSNISIKVWLLLEEKLNLF